MKFYFPRMVCASRISFLFVLICLIFQTFSKEFILGEYYFNQHHYLDLCSNKNNLSLHCNGQCVLMKKIKENEKEENRNPQKSTENKKDLYYANFTNGTLPTVWDFPRIKHYSTFKDLGTFLLIFKLFRPPILSFAA